MIEILFESTKPIYKQIVEQILRQVKQGILRPGDRLPTERELAEQLQIARGTVKKAYKELADNNIIEVIQGSGSYIYNDRDVYDVEHRKLASQLIEQMLDKLESWNLSEREISAMLRLSLAKRSAMQALVRLALVDCNPESLTLFKRQLSYIPGISSSVFLVDTVILEDDAGRLFENFDLVLTTVTHYEQVANCLAGTQIPVVAVDVSPSRQTIVSISTLPPEASIGILCQSNKFSNLICEQMELFTGSACKLPVYFGADLQHTVRFMKKFDAVIVAPDLPVLDPTLSKNAVQEYQAKGGKVIPFDYFIDKGSLMHVEQLVDEIMQKKERPSL